MEIISSIWRNMKEKPQSPQNINPTPVTFPLNAAEFSRNLLIYCIFIEIFLVLLDVIFSYGNLIDIFSINRLANITRELGLASWFQTIQTFMVALTLWLILLVCKKDTQLAKSATGWRILVFFFLYMAIDDGTQIHERLGDVFRDLFKVETGQEAISWGSKLLEFFPSWPWQIIILPMLAGFGIFMFLFLWHQIKTATARKMLVLAVSFFIMAVCLDFIEGLPKEHGLNLYIWIMNQFDLSFYTVSHFGKSFEEFLEMLGMSLLWYIFVVHLFRLTKQGLLFSPLPTNDSSS